MVDWRPLASTRELKRRAEILSTIRQFFASRQVLEVETPLLATTTATDLHIKSLSVSVESAANRAFYLQTSPEFAMKRLLASGSGSIFQLCKAFRQDEKSRQHNPEFTMLEWYRVGFDMAQLMDEVEQLVNSIVATGEIPRFSYQQVFEEHLGIDPHTVSYDELQRITTQHIEIQQTELTVTDYLQLLLSLVIEPKMPPHWFIHDFPVDQASLARIEEDGNGQAVARRFELFCGGMELANGYYELGDATEQRRRFEADNELRQQRGLPQIPVDEKLLAALAAGFPDCAGVALGVDRLHMVAAGVEDIDAVLGFPLGD